MLDAIYHMTWRYISEQDHDRACEECRQAHDQGPNRTVQRETAGSVSSKRTAGWLNSVPSDRRPLGW
jgi:hypothetical protein